jgi:hypothetical protein
MESLCISPLRAQPLGCVYLAATDFRVFMVLDFAVSALGLVGLFGYAYHRKILQARLWAVWAILLPVWGLMSNFMYKSSLANTALAMSPICPTIRSTVALRSTVERRLGRLNEADGAGATVRMTPPAAQADQRSAGRRPWDSMRPSFRSVPDKVPGDS